MQDTPSLLGEDLHRLFDIGMCFEESGSEQSDELAVMCFEAAAKCRHFDSEYMLALHYETGYGVECNLTKAK